MFKKLKVKLLYSTTYYLQIDRLNKKNNHILEIILRLQIFYDISYRQINWPRILPKV